MVENLGDTDKAWEGQQFTPTDWDWVMFLSGEINATETRFDAVWTACIAVMMACISFIIACLIFRITYLGSSDSILDSTSSTIVIFVSAVISGFIVIFISAVIFGLACCIFWITNEKKSETEKRVESLKKCRNDIFNRLDDPNKILECYLNPVGKKGDKNK